MPMAMATFGDRQGSQWACSWPYFQTQVLAAKKLLAQACSSMSSTLCTQYISRYIWNWTVPHTISQNGKKHPWGLRMDSEAYIDTSESESKAMFSHNVSLNFTQPFLPTTISNSSNHIFELNHNFELVCLSMLMVIGNPDFSLKSKNCYTANRI